MERQNDKGTDNDAYTEEEKGNNNTQTGNCDTETQSDEVKIKSEEKISTTDTGVTFEDKLPKENGDNDLCEYISFTARKTPQAQKIDDVTEEPPLTTTSSNFKRWFVLIAGCFNHTVAVGFPFSLSVLYAEWLNEFGKSNSETALIQSSCTGTFFIGGFLSGLFTSKYGTQKCGMIGGILSTVGLATSYIASSILYLVLLIGVMNGFGLSLCYISSSTVVGMHFHGRSKIMAFAFIAFGSGLGMVIFPLLLEMLIKIYGWRGTLLVIAGIMFNLVAIASIFTAPRRYSNNKYLEKDVKPNSKDDLKFEDNNSSTNRSFQSISSIKNRTESISEISVTSQSQHGDINTNVSQDKLRRVSWSTTKIRLGDNLTNAQKEGSLALFKGVLSNKIYVLFTFSCALSISTFASLLIFFIDYLQSKGFPRADAVTIYLYMNIVNIIVRLLFGFYKQLPHVSGLSMPVIGTSVGCVSAAALPLVGSSYYLNLIAAFGIAIFNASMITSLTVCMVKIVGQEQFPAGLGIAFSLTGLFQTVAGPVSGYIRDTTGNYDASFFSASAALFIGFICFMITMVYRHSVNRNTHSPFDFEIIIRRKSRRCSSILPWKRKSVDLSLTV